MSPSAMNLRLLCHTVEYSYCYDRPLRSLATRYTPDTSLLGKSLPGKSACCLLLCAGISFRRYP